MNIDEILEAIEALGPSRRDALLERLRERYPEARGLVRLPLLTGAHMATIDDKGRIVIPAKLTYALRIVDDPEAEIRVLVVAGLQGRGVAIYPEGVLDGKGGPLDPNGTDDDLRATILGTMDEATLDRQGRVRISAVLREVFDLYGEVVVSGGGDHVLIQPKQHWQSMLMDRLKRTKPKDL